ncbi:MAG: RNA helicase, partial [Acidobacteria bacterium]|nr:RNA helicase [Acidobacteriota bacterium]
MEWFEELDKGIRLRGVVPSGPVTVIDVDRLGADVVNLTYEDGNGSIHRELVYRDSDVELLAGADDRRWSFDADPELFMLVAEAKRISLAYLFDPYLATHSSDVELLPHQIEAVYIDMLPNSPLRFLL